MIIATRKGSNGRRLVRVNEPVPVTLGYALIDHTDTITVRNEGSDGIVYTVNITYEDIDRLVAARHHYQRERT